MRPSKAIPLTRAEKLEMYLGLPEKDTKRVNEQADYSGIETALTDAGRRFRESASAVKSKTAWRFRTPTRKVILVAAALAILLILAIACVCTGFLSRTFNFNKKSSINSVTLPSDVTKKKEEPTASSQTTSVSKDKIVYLTSQKTDSYDGMCTNIINTMNKDGSDKKAFIDAGDSYSLDLSPDGTQIAYNHNDSIWLMNIDGDNRREIVHGEATNEYGAGTFAYPKWSPDGTKIAFIEPVKNPIIYSYDLKTAELFPRISPAGSFLNCWLPDSVGIAYTCYSSGPGRIIAVDYYGGNQRTLFPGPGYNSSTEPLSFASSGDRFLLSKDVRDSMWAIEVLLGQYPSMDLKDLGAVNYGHACWSSDDKAIIVDNYEQNGWSGSIQAINPNTGERWALCTYDKKTGEVVPEESDHAGAPYYFVCNNNVFRVEMGGAVSKLTDSGDVSTLYWR